MPMTPLTRRRMLATAGLAAPMPSKSLLKTWQWIDDRIKPAGEPDGEFRSFETWVNKASSWIGYTGAKCYDAKGRPCRNGKDIQRAREEGAFPVCWYLPHHYPKVTIPTRGEIAAVTYLLENARTTISEIRKIELCSTITYDRIAKVLGKDSLEKIGKEEFALTDYGKEEASFLKQRERRASYV